MEAKKLKIITALVMTDDEVLVEHIYRLLADHNRKRTELLNAKESEEDLAEGDLYEMYLPDENMADTSFEQELSEQKSAEQIMKDKALDQAIYEVEKSIKHGFTAYEDEDEAINQAYKRILTEMK